MLLKRSPGSSTFVFAHVCRLLPAALDLSVPRCSRVRPGKTSPPYNGCGVRAVGVFSRCQRWILNIFVDLVFICPIHNLVFCFTSPCLPRVFFDTSYSYSGFSSVIVTYITRGHLCFAHSTFKRMTLYEPTRV